MTLIERAEEIIGWCRQLAKCSEDPEGTTRTFLSPPMREVHARLAAWMEQVGMTVRVDAAGNLRGEYAADHALATTTTARRLLIASHLDTVPNAGAFDGILGVVFGIAVVEALAGRRFPYAIEIIGFSDEEGTRFGVPFIGSRALVGTVDEALLAQADAGGTTVREAVRAYGLDPAALPDAAIAADVRGYLEIHIEQGPVLDRLGEPLAVVDAIAGQSRGRLTFAGAANHAGTTPMDARRDALAAAAEWILAVERHASNVNGLVATVGSIAAVPNAANVIAGSCRVSLDVRHRDDAVRRTAAATLVDQARAIAGRRRLKLDVEAQLDQPAVAMDPKLTATLARAVESAGYRLHHLTSGAGHDAMIVAARAPVSMLFVRSPGGISHHPDETVHAADVAAALAAALRFLETLHDD